MARHTRNGVKALGIFMTSLVTEIEPADFNLRWVSVEVNDGIITQILSIG